MLSTLILLAALSGCPNGQCAAPQRSVVVKRVVEAAPVRKIVKSVRTHRVRLFHRLFR